VAQLRKSGDDKGSDPIVTHEMGSDPT
jgi:hypothetical protein